MARYEFWTHGAYVAVEFPSRALEIRRAGWGTLIRQAANSVNWFHIALPTPSIIDGDDVRVREARLRASVNENARVDLIHYRTDGNPLILSRSVMLTDREINEAFQGPDTVMNGGLTLSVHVAFLTGTPDGTVIFRAAGATFLT
jgi:hypothetical protein